MPHLSTTLADSTEAEAAIPVIPEIPPPMLLIDIKPISPIPASSFPTIIRGLQPPTNTKMKRVTIVKIFNQPPEV